jgi:hypothetical protein
VIDPVHVELTLQAAAVAAGAIESITRYRPLLGVPNGEVAGFHFALDALRCFYRPPAPVPEKPKRAPKPKTTRKPQKAKAARPEPAEEPSEWDPEPLYEASHCQALLMEIIRRASHDYVLYRQHRKLELKALAEQAYTWLFEEEPGHPAWKSRERSVFKIDDEETGQTRVEVGSRRLTSFLSICEACSLDPDAVREHVRGLTVESIMRTGRHVERRSSKSSADAVNLEMHSLIDVDIDLLDLENSSSSREFYEAPDHSYGMDQPW